MFGHFEQDFFIIPLAFIQRDSIMSKALVRTLLGDLYTAMTVKTASTIAFIVLGALLLVLAIYMCLRFRKVRKNEEMGISGDNKINARLQETSQDPSSLLADL